MLDRKAFYLNFDLDASTFKYGRVKGYPGHFQGYGAVSAATSTTVTGVAGNESFGPLRVGDYIVIQTGETTYVRRRVNAKASNDSITVSGAALTLVSVPWFFLPFDIGTTDADGGHATEAYEQAWVEFDWTLADSLDIAIEVRGHAPASKWEGPVFTGTYAAAAAPPDPVEITELIGSVRVGVKATTTFGGTDDISIYLSGNYRR